MSFPKSPKPAEIRAAREAAGLTQADAAALIYKSRRAWESWEGGINDMDPAFWEYWKIRVAGVAQLRK